MAERTSLQICFVRRPQVDLAETVQAQSFQSVGDLQDCWETEPDIVLEPGLICLVPLGGHFQVLEDVAALPAIENRFQSGPVR